MAQSLRKSTFGEIRDFRENDEKRSHTRLFHELREVTMAEGCRRRSLSQVVIGFSELKREALRDDDTSFYGDPADSSASSDGSDDSGDESSSASLLTLPADSDAEENLDETNTGASAAPSLAASTGARKKARVPEVEETSLQKISDRCARCDKQSRLIFLSGLLDALANRGESQHHMSLAARLGTPRSRVTYRYEVSGIKVCMAVFLYANSASRNDLHTVQSHLDAGMVVPPTHGNVISTAWHAVSEADTVKVRDFIQHYASVHGLPQPSAPRGHNIPALTYLPSSCTKLLVHALYVKAGGSVSYRTWLQLWARDCPSVIIMQPKEDVCGECSDLQSKSVRVKTEVSRQQSVDKLKKHMEAANEARDHYRELI